MDANLTKQAINAAIAGDWNSAVKLNSLLIEKYPKNLEAFNRLAFALLQTQKPKKAIEIYKSILQVDPNNPVAERNLLKAKKQLNIKTEQPNNNQRQNPALSRPEIFIIEPGKTLNASLVNLAPQSILNCLCISQKVKLIPKKNTVEIREASGIYIGSLPDDLSFKIRNSINKGISFSAYIKKTSIKKIEILIRET